MWRALAWLAAACCLAACVQLPPSQADIEAKRFHPVADKAAIYVVRRPLDSDQAGALMLDDRFSLTTLRGTFHRWDVEPGLHKIDGIGPSGVRVTLNAAPGRIYYFVHSVFGTDLTGPTMQILQPIDEAQGRALVMRSQYFP